MTTPSLDFSIRGIHKIAQGLVEDLPFVVIPLNMEDRQCRRVRLIDAWERVYIVNAETIEDMMEDPNPTLEQLYDWQGEGYHVF